ncbi:O-antigen ligase family protein [uncultured Pontibacter sp.]|uniref:O-antigen ligase family protein n=1 Tax=uncultured Pontibacter sp. TaxID=453356 RepID=UPI0026175059|nr:O-antigen ligase family protein [uncultured Pontibacter sp.]
MDVVIQEKWNSTSKAAYISLLFYAVSLPVSLVLLNNIAVGILVLVWIFAIIKKDLQKPNNIVLFYLLLAFFAMHLLGTIYSENIKEAFSQLERKSLLFIMPLVLGTLPRLSPKKVNTILIAFAVSTTLISTLCLVSTFYNNLSQGIELEIYNAWYFSSDSLVNAYGFHPNYLAMYCVFSIFIFSRSFISAFQKKQYYKALLISCLVLFLIVFVAMLSARMQIISLILITLFAITYYAVVKRKIFIGFVSIVFFGLVIASAIAFSPILKEKFKGLMNIELSKDNQKFSANLRLQKWDASYNIFIANPITGVGTGDMQDALQKEYKELNYKVPYELEYNSHNQFLDTAGRLGLLGLIILLINLFYPLFIAAKENNGLYLSFLLLLILSCIPEVVLSLNKGIAFYAFVNSLFIFHGTKYNSELHT